MGKRRVRLFIWLAIAVVLCSLAIGFYMKPLMPEQMASHWDMKGYADGTVSRFWGVLILPIVMVVSIMLFYVLPMVDPLRKNVDGFIVYYDGFVLMFTLFMAYLYMLTLIWNLGIKFSMGAMIVPAFAVLFTYMGVLLRAAKRNWFVGIRTPWTLSSDKIWNKTHSIAGTLLMIAGGISLLGMLFTSYALWFLLVPVIVVMIFSFIYSYALYAGDKGR